MIVVERVKELNEDLDWAEFLRNQYNLFFDPKFLSYNDKFGKGICWHHLKFRDTRNNKLLALMTGCELNENGLKRFISCNGVSFGSFWWKRRSYVVDYIKAIPEFLNYMRENSFDKITLRSYPFLYDAMPCEENEYALLYKGFRILKVSITNIINLSEFEFRNIAEKKRAINRGAKKFEFFEYSSKDESTLFNDLFEILLKDRGAKNVKPTHTLDEIRYLKESVNDRIRIFYSTCEGLPVSVCYLFEITPDVILNFYLAIDTNENIDGASDFTLYKTIEWAKGNGFKYYDIGTSDIKGNLLEGLFSFKRRFLGFGYLRKVFEYNLT
ncbi:MAG: hypothetical protein OZ913_04450 [Ignavibacteriaceae bacterium]|jgi:hypothetical protein|nr:MAG: hypothetical protein UZ04_CHB001000596 [Chlorobi bacterium OLB4]MBW7855251.1 hypothetical protein [Ignavibacteria bacterium]MEB2329533.1 hypothetical protein [Ignavibacteriaceae bacterium]OQY77828.1 MAG: hypothetical protein B6D43_04780 [Ignavibacteriales bacterium UTCHB1]